MKSILQAEVEWTRDSYTLVLWQVNQWTFGDCASLRSPVIVSYFFQKKRFAQGWWDNRYRSLTCLKEYRLDKHSVMYNGRLFVIVYARVNIVVAGGYYLVTYIWWLSEIAIATGTLARALLRPLWIMLNYRSAVACFIRFNVSAADRFQSRCRLFGLFR